jgi:hypothetical protein
MSLITPLNSSVPAHIIDFEIPHETGKAGAEFFDGWIEMRKRSCLPNKAHYCSMPTLKHPVAFCRHTPTAHE